MSPLELVLSDERGDLATFRRDARGVTSLVAVSEDVRGDIERIMRRGLSEWIGEPESKRQRVTQPTEPEFFERVAGYFRRLGLVAQKET